MQRMGDQINKSFDKQMNYMREKLGPVTSIRSSALNEPLPLLVNQAPQLSYDNVKILSCPPLPGFMTNISSGMFEYGSSSSNKTG